MKFSFTTLGCPYHSFEDMIDLAKRTGYTGVEFRIYKGTEDLRKLEEFQRPGIDATRRLFQNAGIKIVCVSSSARFAYPDPENLKQQIQLAEDFMKIASDLECPYLRVFGGPYPLNFTNCKRADPSTEEYRASLPPEKVVGLTREECDKWLMDSLGKIGEMSKKYGVMPLMETHDDFCSGNVVSRLINGCGSDNVGILWDCLHPYRYGLDLHETFDVVRDKIHHVHMKDATNLTPWSFKPALVGEGEMDVRTAVNILKKNNYSEFISFEWEKMWYPDVQEPEVSFPQFLNAVSQMLEEKG